MRPFAFALASIFALAVGAADHPTWCTPTTSDPEFDSRRDLVDAGPQFYLDNDPCYDCLWSIWLYQESNGMPGLQRDDPKKDDTCEGAIAGDTIIF